MLIKECQAEIETLLAHTHSLPSQSFNFDVKENKILVESSLDLKFLAT